MPVVLKILINSRSARAISSAEIPA